MNKNAYCTYCKADTNHKVVASHSKWYPREGYLKKDKDSLALKEAYTVYNLTESVYQCLGCNKFHIYYKEIHPCDPSIEEIEYQVPIKREREQPKWFKHVNVDHISILGEIYHNYNYKNFISFSICCRTFIDKLLTDALGDIGGFEKKMRKYQENGFITDNQANILNFLVQAGNASAHRAYVPSKEVAEALLDTIEFLVKEKIISKKTNQYQSDIPSRKK